MDVKFAFLYGDSDEKIYMKQPRDFIKKRNENLVCLSKKSLNSLKQDPRELYKRFNSFITKISFEKCDYDKCIYFKLNHVLRLSYLLLYVDDILIACFIQYYFVQICDIIVG